LNEEMKGLSEQIAALELVFKAKVGETGKLYGSITQQQIIDTVNEKLHVNLDRRQIETQPLRQTGEHMVRIRLTYDLIPEVTVWVESDEEVEEESVESRKKRTEKIEEIVETEGTAVEAEAVDTVEDVETEAVEAVEAEAVTTDADEAAMSDEDEQAEA
jgi:large subunit ribosomal protein L9